LVHNFAFIIQILGEYQKKRKKKDYDRLLKKQFNHKTTKI